MPLRDKTTAVRIATLGDQLVHMASESWWTEHMSLVPYWEDYCVEKVPGRAVSNTVVGPPFG
jgi:hypothetical protein